VLLQNSVNLHNPAVGLCMLESGQLDGHVGKKRAQNGQKVACLLKKLCQKRSKNKKQTKNSCFLGFS
jgi:hypothetical protein